MNLGWLGILRLGLVQAALGAIVVITTSTLNRVMVVELALPALLPGLLVAWHHGVQVLRPCFGHGSDVGGRRTPWMLGGIALLGAGAVLAAWATGRMAASPATGIALSVLAFSLVGLGASSCGTSLLALLAKRVAAERRAAAATAVWLMMILGFAVTAGVAGRFLDPYTPQRLLAVTTVVALAALVLAALALWGVEGRAPAAAPAGSRARPDFRRALREAWAEPAARRFTVFVFVSMLAFSAQDLILEPFAGAVFGYSPGRSTQLSGVQHGGVLLGMLAAAFAGRRWRGHGVGSLRGWTIGGCLASALALAGLAASGLVGPGWPLATTVFALGAANGAFSIAAIGSMMRLAGEGPAGSEGLRMGLWGAAQALAFGLGGLLGTAAADLARGWLHPAGAAYSLVFALEALLFVASAVLAAGVEPAAAARAPMTLPRGPLARSSPGGWR